jgi:hypothetical protein
MQNAKFLLMFFTNTKLLRCESKRYSSTYMNGMSTMFSSAAFLYSLLKTYDPRHIY